MLQSKSRRPDPAPKPRPMGLPAMLALLCLALPAGAAHLDVAVEGVDGVLRDAVLAGVEAHQYRGRDVSEAQATRLSERAPDEARKALEPFGYYAATAEASLEGEGGQRRIRLTVDPGEPTRISSLAIDLPAAATALPEVGKALAGFTPRVGDVLEHPAWEKGKATIQAALVGNGFLEAEATTHRVAVTRATHSAAIDLGWTLGPRYRFGPTHFSGAQFPDAFLARRVPWKEGDFYTQDDLLALQQRLVDADYFSLVQVQPDTEHATEGSLPIEVELVPAKRTVYTGGLFVGTDTGPGLRGGIDRRWVNSRGHKLRFDTLLAQRLRTAQAQYQIPLAGPDNHNLAFGAGFRDEDTDTSRSRTFNLAATDTRLWHGWTRTLGLKFLTGNFEVANLRGDTTLLYPEATFTRKSADDPMFVHRGWSLTLTARAAQEGVLADTSFLQAIADAKWIRAIGERSRFIARGTLGSTAVGDFNKLPPELRFFAGGDRSIRGYAYQTIGPPLADWQVPIATAICEARPGRRCQDLVAGGRNLLVASAEYEYYFRPDWGIAAFVDTGDAFDGRSDYKQRVGAGLGLRWRSPVGMIRVDLGVPVNDHDHKGVQLHIVIGPDL